MPLAPMGCAVQFHIKPSRRKTFGEHSSDDWYLKTSPEHYQTHVVLVKATRAKRLTDTVFFKHKSITQSTIMKADAIVNAYQKLTEAINGIQQSPDDAHIEALQRIQDSLEPGNQMPVQKFGELPPRVEQDQAKNDVLTFEPRPRVQFDATVETPDRLVVAWPQEQVVRSSPKKPIAKPKPILNRPKYIADSESVACRVKQRHASPQAEANDQLSVAERVENRRRGQKLPTDVLHTVLDQETGELLEYCQLLKHPQFKDEWNRSAADEFGRLAQGVGGRIKGTDTIRFIHKHEVPTYVKFVCTIRTE
jgi:hypothetical protein